MDMKTSLPHVAAAGAALLLALTACSSGSSGSSDSSSSDSSRASSSSGSAGGSSGKAPVAATGSEPDQRADPKAPTLAEPSIISTGTVALHARDVGEARGAVRQVATRYAGAVTDEETTTSDDGRMGAASLVLRVPARSFSRAMGDVEQVADLVDSSTTSQDVSTQVIDVDERVKAARASIDRITTLLARAERIGDVMAIEAQLSRREADLNSLLRQQAHLADQTSLATITVSIDRPTAAHLPQPADTGFVAGLRGGWHALRGFTTGVSTVAGAVLPWVPVALLVAVPVWLLARRSRRTAGPAPAEVSP